MSIWTDLIQELISMRMDRLLDCPVCYACLQDLDGVGRMVCPSGLALLRNGQM